jgi:hypothetical protein
MADVVTYFLSGVGAVTGVVGAVTGVIALIRTGRFKTLDLRLELRKAENDLRALIDELPALMQRAVQSRSAINDARGMFDSTALAAFVQTMEEDTKAIQELTKERPADGQDHRKLSAAELESRIIKLHAVLPNAKKLRDKFTASLADDDAERDRLRDSKDARARDLAARPPGG